MKKILLPTDFSENSLNAINYAMRFFENWECDFYVLNVQKFSEYISDDLVTGSKTDTIYDSIASDNKKLINQLVKKLNKQTKSQSYTFHGLFDYDDFVSAIDQVVKFHSIDLIIMGTNGATGADEVIFGSNTLRVIRNVNCPILIIPQGYTFKVVRKTMLCIPQQDEFTEEVFVPLKKLLHIHQSELHLIELNDDAIARCELEDNEALRRIFDDFSYHYYCLNQSSEWTVINTATQLLKIDLTTIFVHKKTFIERLLFGTETPKITFGTRVPLLLLQEK